MDALEDTAEFLQRCAEFFQNVHSIKIKHAYAEVFAQLLEPIASVLFYHANKKLQYLSKIATAEVNLPAWVKTVDLIFPKANKMIAKPRHMEVVY